MLFFLFSSFWSNVWTMSRVKTCLYLYDPCDSTRDLSFSLGGLILDPGLQHPVALLQMLETNFLEIDLRT